MPGNSQCGLHVLYIVICATRSIQDAKQVVLYKMKDYMVLFLIIIFSFLGEGFLLKSLFTFARTYLSDDHSKGDRRYDKLTARKIRSSSQNISSPFPFHCAHGSLKCSFFFKDGTCRVLSLLIHDMYCTAYFGARTITRTVHTWSLLCDVCSVSGFVPPTPKF